MARFVGMLRLTALCGVMIASTVSVVHAGTIRFVYHVEDERSILNGATVQTFVDTPLVWGDLNSDPTITPRSPDNVYFGVRDVWTTTIRGATGVGAAWNGEYMFIGDVELYSSTRTVDFVTGGRIFERFDGSFRMSGPAGLSDEGTASPAVWTDGEKTFRFGGAGISAPALPVAGDPVRPEDFGPLQLFQFFSVEASVPEFSQPRGGTFNAAIPLPPALPLLAAGFGSLYLLRRSRQ